MLRCFLYNWKNSFALAHFKLLPCFFRRNQSTLTMPKGSGFQCLKKLCSSISVYFHQIFCSFHGRCSGFCNGIHNVFWTRGSAGHKNAFHVRPGRRNFGSNGLNKAIRSRRNRANTFWFPVRNHPQRKDDQVMIFRYDTAPVLIFIV